MDTSIEQTFIKKYLPYLPNAAKSLNHRSQFLESRCNEISKLVFEFNRTLLVEGPENGKKSLIKTIQRVETLANSMELELKELRELTSSVVVNLKCLDE